MSMTLFFSATIGMVIGWLLIPFAYYFAERVWNAEERIIRKHEAKRCDKQLKKELKKLDKQRLTDEKIIKIEEQEE